MALNEEDLGEYSLKDFRQNLTRILGEVVHTRKRIRVTSYGRVAGYFVSAEDMAYFEALEEREDVRALEETLAKGPDRKTYTLEQVRQELGL